MTHALEEAVASAAGARAKLIALVDAIIVYFDAEPHLFDLIQAVEVLRRGERFPWQQARDVAVRLLHAIFDEGRKTGEFAVRDPELASLVLFGGLRSVVRFGGRPRPRRLAERVVTAVLDGAAV